MSTGLLWGQPQCGRRTSGRPYICWSLCEAVGSRLDVKLVAVDGLACVLLCVARPVLCYGRCGGSLRGGFRFLHCLRVACGLCVESCGSCGSCWHAKLVAVDGLAHLHMHICVLLHCHDFGTIHIWQDIISLGANRQTEWENRGGLAMVWSCCGAKLVVLVVIWVWFGREACRCGRPVACCWENRGSLAMVWSCCGAKLVVLVVIWVWFARQACRCGRPVACCCLVLCKWRLVVARTVLWFATVAVIWCVASTHTLGSWAQGVHRWPGADAFLCLAMTCPTMR